ncbi:cation/H(+) antiporter 4-like [Carica papaya]|uniref:cation/H(+) antiporter 4-like n=1 Tax=Carica papaya TaxID=3649 RepID=UPI000B8C8824|nr:cation/H(+) antiporter 4-like [Carica papaya]
MENDLECVKLPPLVNSYGIWERLEDPVNGSKLWDYSFPVLESLLVIIFFFWQLIYFMFKRFGVSNFTAQIAAGLLLSIIALYKRGGLEEILFPKGYRENVIGTMGTFGYTMFWFLMGVKMNLGLVARTGWKALAIGFCSVIGPLFMSLVFYHRELKVTSGFNSPTGFIIFFQCTSPFPVIAALIIDMKIQNSELGRHSLSSVFMSDLLGVFLSLLFHFIQNGFNNITHAVIDVVAILLFMIFTVSIWRPAMYWIIKRTPEGKPVKTIYIYFIIVAVFGAGAYWAFFEQYVPFGPYFLGLFLPAGPPLGSALIDKFECLVTGSLLPFFVASCAMHANLSTAAKLEGLTIILVTFAAKFVVCLVSCLLSKMPLRDSIALALVINHKGTIELSAYSYGLQIEIIRDEHFSTMTLYILISSYILPILVKMVYDPSRKYTGYQKRDIIHLKPNSELRILACIHRPDNIAPMINLLEASCPTKDNPVDVYVLHLIELIGQASPLFISHQIQKKKVGTKSYSDNVIISFNNFQKNFWGLVSVSTFTSISSLECMYEDACTLALDKLTSLILLPFHRTWSIDGSIVISDNNMIRNLNCSVLGVAPCSVGILVDRSRIGQKEKSIDESYHVGMIFFGGEDDREALTLAKRMSKDSRSNLTVIHFLLSSGVVVSDWNSMLDSTHLREFKHNSGGQGCGMYIEETVKDASETALVLRSMVDYYDLFIVGKGGGMGTPFTAGLDEWTEFPELGVIGDLLSQPDLDSRASVLIVQHQKQSL